MDSLELLNYRTLEATNGREALATLEQHGDDVNLILSDVMMPEMDGRALLRALREMASAIPVVMLTGHSSKETVEELQGLGIVWFQSKTEPDGPTDGRRRNNKYANV